MFDLYLITFCEKACATNWISFTGVMNEIGNVNAGRGNFRGVWWPKLPAEALKFSTGIVILYQNVSKNPVKEGHRS